MTPKKATKAVPESPKPSTSPEVRPRTRAKSITTKTPSPIVELTAKPAVKRHVSASARKSKKAVVESTNAPSMKLDRSTTTDEVAVRAYHIWMERGCPEGTSAEDWLTAETELRAMSATA